MRLAENLLMVLFRTEFNIQFLFERGKDSRTARPADVAVYGDIHTAYMQTLFTVKDRILLNVGSVGNPLDMAQASYVILEGGENADAGLAVQFVRLPYDIDRAVALARERGVPDLEGYIGELRTAEYFRRG